MQNKFSFELTLANESFATNCLPLLDVLLKDAGQIIYSCHHLLTTKMISSFNFVEDSCKYGICSIYIMRSAKSSYVDILIFLFPVYNGTRYQRQSCYFNAVRILLPNKVISCGQVALALKSDDKISTSNNGSVIIILQDQNSDAFIFAEKMAEMEFKELSKDVMHDISREKDCSAGLEISVCPDNWNFSMSGDRGILALYDTDRVTIIDIEAEDNIADSDGSSLL